jgi:site-specific recombinase XerD
MAVHDRGGRLAKWPLGRTILGRDNGGVSGPSSPRSRRSRSLPEHLCDSTERDTALVLADQHLELGRLELVAERARDYARNARAPNTIRAYRAAWSDFTTWCTLAARHALPADPDTVAMYLTSLADGGLKTSTMQIRLSAISQAHKAAQLETPTRSATVSAVWSGIRRTLGTAQEGKAPTLVDDLRQMVAAMSPRRGQTWSKLELRDRALLLVGFAGAFRRSELVAIDVDDLDVSRAGVVIRQQRSKTDQEGQGRRIGIPNGSRADTCPVRALQAWLAASGITSGPVFRRVNRHGQVLAQRLSGEGVAIVVKRRAAAAGLDPERLAGHSLRAGLATSAAAAGASERSIMAQTGHRSVVMVRRYIRDGELFGEGNAAAVAALMAGTFDQVAHPYMRARHGVWAQKFAHGQLDILEVLKFHGVPERQLRQLRAKSHKGRRSDGPRCGARRRDGGQCEMRAVCDRMTGRPLHGGRCRSHGGFSTGPRTLAGKAAIAASNRRRAASTDGKLFGADNARSVAGL